MALALSWLGLVWLESLNLDESNTNATQAWPQDASLISHLFRIYVAFMLRMITLMLHLSNAVHNVLQ